MLIAVAIFTGLWYFICKTDVGYAITHAIRQPLFVALPIGLLMGNLKQAIIIGAAIQVLYIGLVAAGSNLPADDCLAGLIAIPVALSANLTPELAVAVAVPIGILGVFIDQLRKTIDAAFVHMADRYAEEGNTRGITLSAIVYPSILSFFLRFPIPFFANLFGAKAVTTFMDWLPQWIVHGFSITGGILPALGFAITMFVIGKRNLLPYFFIGYFLIQYSHIPVMGAAIFGICVTLLLAFNEVKKGKEEGVKIA